MSKTKTKNQEGAAEYFVSPLSFMFNSAAAFESQLEEGEVDCKSRGTVPP